MKNLTLGLLLMASAFVVKASDLVCESASECPEGVGQLKIKETDNSFKSCTGFLVKEDVIATNLHCIPETLQKVGTSCASRIKISFPNKSKDKPEANECDKVVFLSAPLHQNRLNVDLALIKFQRPFNSKVFKISQEGFLFNAKFTVYKIDPTNGGGILKRVDCLPKPKTVLNPYFTSEKSPIINLHPCVAVPGNSGSPILSADGYVRGMLSSGGGLGVKDIKQEMNTIFGSNFSCVDFAMLGYPSRNLSACDTPISPEEENKLVKDYFVKANAKLLAKVEERLQFERRFKDSAMRVFSWNLVANEKNHNKEQKVSKSGEYVIRDVIFSMVPKCIQYKGLPLDFLRRKITDNNVLELNFDLPEFVTKSKIADNLDMAVDMTEVNLKHRVKVPSKEFFNNSLVHFEVEILSGTPGKSGITEKTTEKITEKWELAACE